MRERSPRHSRPKFLLRPHCHTGGAARYIATICEPDKDPVPGGIKGHIATALNENPEGRRGARVDCRCYARTDR